MVDRNESEGIRSGDIWYKRISWASIFAGVFVAVVIQFTLTVLGVAIGLTAIDPFSGESAQALGAGAAIWFVITGVISLFCGGWITGRLSGDVVKLDRGIHGLVVWSLSVLLTFYLSATTASMLIGGLFGVVESGAGAIGEAAPVISQYAEELMGPDSPIQEIQQQGHQIIEQMQEATPEEREEMQQALQSIGAAINELVTDGEISEQNRQALTEALIEYGDMSPQEAQSTVGEWEQSAQEIREEVMQSVEEAREAAMMAVWGLFFVLVLGAAATVAGAVVAGNPDATRP